MMNPITNGLLETPYVHYLNLKSETEEHHKNQHSKCDTAYHSFFELLTD